MEERKRQEQLAQPLEMSWVSDESLISFPLYCDETVKVKVVLKVSDIICTKVSNAFIYMYVQSVFYG